MIPRKACVFITEAITFLSTVRGINTRFPLTTAGQCWLPRAWPSSTQVRTNTSGVCVCSAPNSTTITSLRVTRATVAACRAFVPHQHVPIAQEDSAWQRYSQINPVLTQLPQATLLRFPLVERQPIQRRVFQACFPNGFVNVAGDGFNDKHRTGIMKCS